MGAYGDRYASTPHLILDQLEADGLADDTIVFFYGDHGRGLPRAKRWVYDSGLRVPLIVRWKNHIEPGAVRDDLVSLLDLAPTVLALAGIPVPPQMQDQVFLGDKRAASRDYIVAHRDRMNEAEDRIRAIRDRRYKYIRNFHPERSRAQFILYGYEMPTMQEWQRLYKQDSVEMSERVGSPGALTPAQCAYFAATKPLEELYDTERDSHELTNLAASPSHRRTLLGMRARLDAWIRTTNDLGAIPEDELKRRMRPGGKWATTAAPRIKVADDAEHAAKIHAESRVTIKLACPTAGASIAYTTEHGDTARWSLYSRPVTLDRRARLRAKACRLGYKTARKSRSTCEQSRSVAVESSARERWKRT